jgi:hypothetical protein
MYDDVAGDDRCVLNLVPRIVLSSSIASLACTDSSTGSSVYPSSASRVLLIAISEMIAINTAKVPRCDVANFCAGRYVGSMDPSVFSKLVAAHRRHRRPQIRPRLTQKNLPIFLQSAEPAPRMLGRRMRLGYA